MWPQAFWEGGQTESQKKETEKEDEEQEQEQEHRSKGPDFSPLQTERQNEKSKVIPVQEVLLRTRTSDTLH